LPSGGRVEKQADQKPFDAKTKVAQGPYFAEVKRLVDSANTAREVRLMAAVRRQAVSASKILEEQIAEQAARSQA
jgi:hypothetical protein